MGRRFGGTCRSAKWAPKLVGTFSGHLVHICGHIRGHRKLVGTFVGTLVGTLVGTFFLMGTSVGTLVSPTGPAEKLRGFFFWIPKSKIASEFTWVLQVARGNTSSTASQAAVIDNNNTNDFCYVMSSRPTGLQLLTNHTSNGTCLRGETGVGVPIFTFPSQIQFGTSRAMAQWYHQVGYGGHP